MKKPNNPNAFPVDGPFAFESLQKGNSGMTIRDYFAAKAMQEYIAIYEAINAQKVVGIEILPDSEIARRSYQAADAMLKEREK